MTYYEFKQQQQEEVNSFPMVFAFNNQQFEDGCRSLGVHPDNAKEALYSIPGGGFIRKTDSKTFALMLDRLSDDLSEKLKDYDFALAALTYELNNHEYMITMDVIPTLDALGLTLEEVKGSDILSGALAEARKMCIESVSA